MKVSKSRENIIGKVGDLASYNSIFQHKTLLLLVIDESHFMLQSYKKIKKIKVNFLIECAFLIKKAKSQKHIEDIEKSHQDSILLGVITWHMSQLGTKQSTY